MTFKMYRYKWRMWWDKRKMRLAEEQLKKTDGYNFFKKVDVILKKHNVRPDTLYVEDLQKNFGYE